MGNTPNTSLRRRKVVWLFLPFLIILLLLATKSLLIQKDKPTTENDSESSSFVSQPTIIAFSPKDISNLIDYDEDGIAGICAEREFRYKELDKQHQYTLYNTEGALAEQIVTWPEQPNRIMYCLSNKKSYDEFQAQLLRLPIRELSPAEKDVDYNKYRHREVENCVFVERGYSLEKRAYCIVAISKDQIQVSHLEEVDIDNYSPKYATVISTSYFYENPGENRRDDYVPSGEHITHTRQSQGYVFCIYVAPSGIVDSGWLLVSDLGEYRERIPEPPKKSRAELQAEQKKLELENKRQMIGIWEGQLLEKNFIIEIEFVGETIQGYYSYKGSRTYVKGEVNQSEDGNFQLILQSYFNEELSSWFIITCNTLEKEMKGLCITVDGKTVRQPFTLHKR